jgi:hypothetical protein
LGIHIQASAIAAVVLVASFLIAGEWAIQKRLNLHCDCFGLLYRERIGTPTVARDVLLILLAIPVAAFDDGSLALPIIVTKSASSSAIVALVVTGLMIISVAYVAFRATWNLRRPFPHRI